MAVIVTCHAFVGSPFERDTAPERHSRGSDWHLSYVEYPTVSYSNIFITAASYTNFC